MTDHANLQYWKSPRNLNRRTARWHADLQEYDYEILYILGKTNIPPDVLSRLPGADKGETDNQGVVLRSNGLKRRLVQYVVFWQE